MTVVAATFGVLSEVQMMYAIYHFKAQEVNNPMLQTVHNLELKRRSAAIASQSLQAEGSIFQSVAKSPFCYEVISQPFCTVGCISFWRCPIYAASWKLRTSRWKPTSQPCENSLLLRSDFAALLECLRNLADTIFSCEMVPGASRYLLPTFGDILHQIFVV